MLEDDDDWLRENEEEIFKDVDAVALQFNQKKMEVNGTKSNSQSEKEQIKLTPPAQTEKSHSQLSPVISPVLTPESSQDNNNAVLQQKKVNNIGTEATQSTTKRRKSNEEVPIKTEPFDENDFARALVPSPKKVSAIRPIRRIPGPAGNLQDHNDDAKLNDDALQSSYFLSSAPWRKMMQEKGVPPFGTNKLEYNINYAINQLTPTKIPMLLVCLKSLKPSERELISTLTDPSGEIEGILHKLVLEQYSANLVPGCGIILSQVSVFHPTEDSHYVNITRDNIESIIPADCTLDYSSPIDLNNIYDVKEITNNRKNRNALRLPKRKSITNKRIVQSPTAKNAKVSIHNQYNRPNRATASPLPSPVPSPKPTTPKQPIKITSQQNNSPDLQKSIAELLAPNSPVKKSPVIAITKPTLSSPRPNQPQPQPQANTTSTAPTAQPQYLRMPNLNTNKPTSTAPTKATTTSTTSTTPTSSTNSTTPVVGNTVTITKPQISANFQRFLPSGNQTKQKPEQVQELPKAHTEPESEPEATEDEVRSVYDEYGEHHHISEYDEYESRYDSERYADVIPADSSLDEDDEFEALLASMNDDEIIKSVQRSGSL